MKVWPRSISYIPVPFCIIFRVTPFSERWLSRRIRIYLPEIWKFRYMDFGICICLKSMKLDLKWGLMARYALILRLDGALWLRIISGPLLTPIWSTKNENDPANLTIPKCLFVCLCSSGGAIGVLGTRGQYN